MFLHVCMFVQALSPMSLAQWLSDKFIVLFLPLYAETCFVSFHDGLFPLHSLLLSNMTHTDWNFGCTKYAKQRFIGPICKYMFAQPSYHAYKISFATSEEGLRTPAVIEYFETLGHLSNSIAQLLRAKSPVFWRWGQKCVAFLFAFHRFYDSTRAFFKRRSHNLIFTWTRVVVRLMCPSVPGL